MSILTLALLTNLLLYLVIFEKPRATKTIRILTIILALMVIFSSQHYPNGNYFAEEQFGHAREAYYWMSTKCQLRYSFFEPFKTLAMHLACITNRAWLFDFTYKLIFSLLLIGIAFSDKFIAFDSQFEDFRIRNTLLLISTPLIASMLYGALRGTVASLVLLVSVALYRKQFHHSLLVSIASSFFHTVGLIAFPGAIIRRLAEKLKKQKKSRKFQLIFLIILSQIVFFIFVIRISSDYLTGVSEYIGNKNATVYREMGASTTATIFGIPRSAIILLILFMFSVFFLKNKKFLSGSENFSILYYLVILIFMGLLISPQVSARFVGLFFPSILFLVFLSLQASKRSYYKLLGLVLMAYLIFDTYFDSYQIGQAKRHDILGLPYIYSILLHIQ